ncbi:hypothetical protein D3C72_1623620 [compost metagenome]
MARYVETIDGRNQAVTKFINIDANQTIKTGDLIQINGATGKGVVAVAASTTLIGIAQKDITTGATVTSKDNIPVTLLKSAVVRIDYTGTTKSSLAETDLYTVKFDLGSKNTVNLDDTTGGMCQVIAYDNTKKTADVVFTAASQVL